MFSEIPAKTKKVGVPDDGLSDPVPATLTPTFDSRTAVCFSKSCSQAQLTCNVRLRLQHDCMRAPDAWTLSLLAGDGPMLIANINQSWSSATRKRDAYYNGAHNQREAEETYCREPNVGHELSELPRFRAQGVMEFGSRAQASQDHLRLKALMPVTLQPGDCRH